MNGKIPFLLHLSRMFTAHDTERKTEQNVNENDPLETNINVNPNTNDKLHIPSNLNTPITANCNITTNMNTMFSSNNANSTPLPIKNSTMSFNPYHCNAQYHRDIIQLNHELQRQIEVLKQCGNDEIKMLKARIQTLEKRVFETSINSNNDNRFDEDYKENETQICAQCTQGTPTKMCPNIRSIVNVSQIYNTLLKSKKQHNELEIWRIINVSCTKKQYDLGTLIADYTHLLEVHCNNNNIFELRIVCLEINDIIESECHDTPCQCIENIKEISLKPNVIYILDVIHCLLYHMNGYNNNNNENMQILRDCIMEQNEMIMKYDPTENEQKDIHENVNTNYQCFIPPSTPNEEKKLKLIISPIKPKPSAIELSEERIRTLSGTITEQQIKELIDEYDNDEKIAIENDDEETSSTTSTLSDDERAEIQRLKVKLGHKDRGSVDEDTEQRGASTHNLMRSVEGNEWDVDTMDQTVQDMKKQLLHLALTSNSATKLDTHL